MHIHVYIQVLHFTYAIFQSVDFLNNMTLPRMLLNDLKISSEPYNICVLTVEYSPVGRM